MEFLLLQRNKVFHNVSIFRFSSSLICFTLISLTSVAAAAMVLSNDTDYLSLMAIKSEITGDPFGVLNSWNNSQHFCTWGGVSCGRKHRQRVVVLDLSSQKLVGKLSPHIGNLSFLRELDLSDNFFDSKIPNQITHLPRLRILQMANNSFGGPVPSNISYLSNLQTLNLARCKLTGKIPRELGHLQKLEMLVLHTNNFAGTTIPQSLGNLSSLVVLHLGRNNLVGVIPDELGNLRMLTGFSSHTNHLHGTIPSQMYNLSSITHFLFDKNKLHGRLPWNIGFTLPHLEFFGVSDNEFSGPIPVSLLNCSNLSILQGVLNQFSGLVPQELGRLKHLSRILLGVNTLGSKEGNDLDFLSSLTNCTELEFVYFGQNNLRGTLPYSIANLSSRLITLDVASNQIYGRIPSEIGSLSNLQYLGLAKNFITGEIPNDLSKLGRLQKLHLYQNKLTGEIPASLGNLTSLAVLSIGGSEISGSIPSELGNCQSLLECYIMYSNLTDNIPVQLFQLTSLNTFTLAGNALTGTLPVQVGNLKNLVNFDVSGNKLSGGIPESLGECVMLQKVYMRQNQFQGTIPQSLSALKSVEVLDISSNNLSGNIPGFLQNLSFLITLNLSSNDFKGMIPLQGVFKNSTAVIVEGNDMLCGGIPDLRLPKCRDVSFTRKSNKTSKLLKAIVAAVVGAIFLASLVLFLIILCQKRLSKPSLISTLGNSILRISYGELLRATDGFSNDCLIGVGSFGSVYKGTIQHEETSIVAVKVLNLQLRGGSKGFTSECNALRNARHRNLVKILNCCSSVDFQGNDFKALVYQFMPNGSLEKWLYPEAFDDQRNLSHVERLNISMDVALALEYLHHDCESTIIHADLKPSNILLDDDMTAHVSDFGIAKVLSSVSDNPTSSYAVKGSIGYVPPEYGLGGDVSVQGDIYSYGILLLEIFTGKKPTSDMFKDGLNLHTFVKGSLPEKVMEIVDSRFMLEEDMDLQLKDCLISILSIGVACSMESPTQRMHIRDVIKELRLIKEKI